MQTRTKATEPRRESRRMLLPPHTMSSQPFSRPSGDAQSNVHIFLDTSLPRQRKPCKGVKRVKHIRRGARNLGKPTLQRKTRTEGGGPVSKYPQISGYTCRCSQNICIRMDDPFAAWRVESRRARTRRGSAAEGSVPRPHRKAGYNSVHMAS